MRPSPAVEVKVDLDRIRLNAERIAAQTKVPLLAVVKADAYGLGATEVVGALRETAASFCFFSLAEAAAAKVWDQTRKPSMTLGPDPEVDADAYLEHHVRPAVWTVERARRLVAARPILSVDTGMQRFGCPAEQVAAVLAAGQCDEAFTHAVRLEQVKQLLEITGGHSLRRHASGSSLLAEPSAWLDAVRPGLALYREACQVSTRLVDSRSTRGAAGYSGFSSAFHGVILAGYSHGLRPGPCLLNGKRSRILETGMQSAYVETDREARAGDRVVLLGEGLEASDVAAAWQCSAQEALVRLAGSGLRNFVCQR